MNLSQLHLHWRVGKRNDKIYKSYSLARSYRENGKNRKKIFFKLGKLSEKEVEYWKIILQASKDPNCQLINANDLIIKDNFYYLDVAVILEVWDFWELNKPFEVEKSKREVPLSSIASLLTINRSIEPKTKSQVPNWFAKTTLPILLNISASEINASRIFRELSAIEDCKDALIKHLYNKNLEKYPDSTKKLFYDLSSTTFTGSHCILMKWGHCKEGYENHIVLALVVNEKGFPVYWETLPGGTADATTIEWLLNSLKKHLKIESLPTLIFDRGMVSEDNLLLLEKEKIKYITAMDKNQIESITEEDFTKFENLNIKNVDEGIKKNNFIKLSNKTYCKETEIKNNRRYILIFNPQLFKDQKQNREEAIISSQTFINNLNEELLEIQKNKSIEVLQKKIEEQFKKLNVKDFIKYDLKEKLISKQINKKLLSIKSYQISITVDEEKKKKTGNLDGFWLLVTNHIEKGNDKFVYDTNSVVEPYREKVIIESSFRDIKSFVDISPVHVWTEKHVKAHYTICVLSHLLNRTISSMLRDNKGNESKEIISHERLYANLKDCLVSSCKIKNIENSCLVKLKEANNLQKDLLDRLKMSHLMDNNVIGNLKAKLGFLS